MGIGHIGPWGESRATRTKPGFGRHGPEVAFWELECSGLPPRGRSPGTPSTEMTNSKSPSALTRTTDARKDSPLAEPSLAGHPY